MKNFTLMILFLSAISCRKDEINYVPSTEPSFKIADLTEFTIEIPSSWEANNLQGIDSYVGEIIMDQNEKVMFDLGWYSNELNVDTNSHDISFTTIDQKSAKIVQPKITGQGTTGVYFDSLDVAKMNKFQISGINLNVSNEQQFLDAISTLNFIE